MSTDRDAHKAKVPQASELFDLPPPSAKVPPGILWGDGSVNNVAFERVYADFERDIQSQELKEVARHWREVYAPGRLPSWTDIRPSAIKKHLPIVWSYDYLPAEDDFVGRLAGDHIVRVSSKPFKATRLSALRPDDKYPRSLIRARRVLNEPALYHGKGLVYTTADSFGLGERIVLPLQGLGSQPAGIFGATKYKSLTDWNASEMAAEEEHWFSLAGVAAAMV